MRKTLITTVKRGYPLEKSGRIITYDLDSKKILKQRSMLPTVCKTMRNPRGGTRGVRGSCIIGDKIYACTHDTISVLDHDLDLLYTLNNPLFCNLHDVVEMDGNLIVASCGNDSIFSIENENKIRVLYSTVFRRGYFSNSFINYNLVDYGGILRPNSLYVYKDTLYVIFANKSIYKLSTDTGYLTKVFDFDFNTPHNFIVSSNKSFLFNNSGTSDLIKVGFNIDIGCNTYKSVLWDKKPFWFINTKKNRWGWLRGLDSIDDVILVGSSPFARICEISGGDSFWHRLSLNPSEAVYSVHPFID